MRNRNATEPGPLARAEDTLTDVASAAIRAKSAVIGFQPDAILESVVQFTRKYPLTSLGAAFGLGLWINRR